jgi:hypothetical protein
MMFLLNNRLDFLCWRSFACFAVLLLVATSPARTEARIGYRTVEATGNGATVEQAINRALVSGITQVNGAAIASRARSSLSAETKTVGGKQVSQSTKQFQEAISKKTKGVVKSYEILSQGRPKGSSLYRVKLSVTVATYKKSAQLNRLRMAVVPFRIDKSIARSKLAQRFEPIIRRGLENYLTQTRRFAMLDRSFLEEQGKELSFLTTAGVAQEEMARIGNRAGTDYIVTGVLEKAYSYNKKFKMRTTGQVIKTPQIGARITYRILDVASTQVKFASTDKIHRESGSMDDAADRLSTILGQKILNAIFPVYVLSVDGDMLTLGQGGDTIKKGAIFSLVKLGEEIIDPYTRESLGQSEKNVGSVKIVDTQSRLSTAKVLKLSVDLDALMRHDFIVRPRKASSAAKKRAAKMKDLEKEFDKEFDEDDDKDKKEKW